MEIELSPLINTEEFSLLMESFPIGIITFNANLEITFFNRNAEDLLNTNLSKGLQLDEIPYINLNSNIEKLKEGYGFEKEFGTAKKGNKQLAIYLKAVPFQGENFSGGIITIEDFAHFKDSVSDVDKKKSILKYLNNYIIVNGSFEITDSKLDENFRLLIDADSGKNLLDEFPPIDKARITYITEQVKVQKKSIVENFVSSDLKINSKILAAPLDENFSKFIFIFIDITSEIESILNYQKQLDDYKNELVFWENLNIPFIICDKEGIITEWQKGAAELFGIKRSKVLRKPISRAIKEFNKELFRLILDEVNNIGKWNSDLSIKLEGREIFVDVTVQRISIKNSKKYLFFFRDITQRKQTEANLRASEERFRNIVTNTSEFILTIDKDGIIQYLNPSFCEKIGKSSSELIDTNFEELLDEEFVEKNNLSLDYLIEYENKSVEIPIKSREGTIFTFGNVSLIRSYNGSLKYLNLILTDITEKKKTERDLQLIKSMFEASRDGILVISKRKIILTNKYFLILFGYENENEVLKRDLLNIVEKEDIKHFADKIQLHEKGDRSISQFEFKALKKDQSNIDIEASITSYEFDEDNYIVLFLRDITENKKAQKNLKLSEERYRNITENINEFFWTYELVGAKLKPVFFTNAVRKITGYEIENFFTDEKFWLRIVHPSDLKQVIKGIKRILNDSTKNSLEQEFRIINKSGIVVWLENKITVVRENKKIVKLFGIVSDISKDKQIEEELKKSAQELKLMNDTKDRFISVISHDLRTPFSSILGFTDVLLNDSSLTEEKRKEYISYIQESSKNMLSLVNSLLDWTRLQTGRIKFEPHKVNARILIDKSVQINSGKALVKKIELINLLTNDLYVHGDENLLLQVFNNLVSNALKFTPENGFIHIEGMELINKKQILFTVRDSGVGIKEEDMEKLFRVDTKYTTRGTSGELGSGLGLSLCKEIVEKHGGSIWVESEVGKGTEFHFTIPVSSNTVLLIDKKKTDRILYKKLLQSLLPGFDIVEADNYNSGLDTIQSIQPALIITDHDLVEKNALDLIHNLKAEDKSYNPPFIILSGEINRSIVEEYNEEGVEYIFKKPVKLNVFKNAIDNSLRKAIYK